MTGPKRYRTAGTFSVTGRPSKRRYSWLRIERKRGATAESQGTSSERQRLMRRAGRAGMQRKLGKRRYAGASGRRCEVPLRYPDTLRGSGTAGTFGGLIQTPTFDALANNGLRYTNFHTTAICAPTRSALLTGRNSASVHVSGFSHTVMSAGSPGWDGRVPATSGTIAEILHDNGYGTSEKLFDPYGF